MGCNAVVRLLHCVSGPPALSQHYFLTKHFWDGVQSPAGTRIGVHSRIGDRTELCRNARLDNPIVWLGATVDCLDHKRLLELTALGNVMSGLHDL